MTQKDGKLPKSQYETLAEFRYQLRRFLRFSEEVTHKEGITPLQYLLLLQIRGYPGRDWATISELAERLQAQHHGVVALVSRCEELDLVTRELNPKNRREVHVRLRPKGRRCLERLADLHMQQLLALQGKFSVPGKTELSDVLTNISELINKS